MENVCLQDAYEIPPRNGHAGEEHAAQKRTQGERGNDVGERHAAGDEDVEEVHGLIGQDVLIQAVLEGVEQGQRVHVERLPEVADGGGIVSMKTGLEQIQFRREEHDSVQDGDSEQPFGFKQRAERRTQFGKCDARSSGQVDSAPVFREFARELPEPASELVGAATASPQREFEPELPRGAHSAAGLEGESEADLIRLEDAIVDAFIFRNDPLMGKSIDQCPFHRQDIDGPFRMAAESGGN